MPTWYWTLKLLPLQLARAPTERDLGQAKQAKVQEIVFASKRSVVKIELTNSAVQMANCCHHGMS